MTVLELINKLEWFEDTAKVTIKQDFTTKKIYHRRYKSR